MKQKMRKKSIEDRQREDPELEIIVDFQKEGMLPSDDKRQDKD